MKGAHKALKTEVKKVKIDDIEVGREGGREVEQGGPEGGWVGGVVFSDFKRGEGSTDEGVHFISFHKQSRA